MQFWSPHEVISRRGEKRAEELQERFRAHFIRVLRRCARRRCSVEESFGIVFEETLEQISLTEIEQSHLYKELLQWAKQSPDVVHSIHNVYSPPTADEIDDGFARPEDGRGASAFNQSGRRASRIASDSV